MPPSGKNFKKLKLKREWLPQMDNDADDPIHTPQIPQ